MLRTKHMGFRSVKLVEVKAETTTPGEVRTTTDATGARVSTSRGRRTLPKLEFSVDEDGAILHGPQRGSALPLSQTGLLSASASGNDANDRDLLYQSAAFHALHMREFPTSPPSVRSSYFFDDVDDAAAAASSKRMSVGAAAAAGPIGRVPPMKECVLNDTRATTMAIKYDAAVDKFVCGSSIERFSGHTGVCRVLGSKKYPVTPHSLQLGDLLRIGSVGLVVCELNRTARDETLEALSDDEYEFLKEHYLSLPLQQTFHPTESVGQHQIATSRNSSGAIPTTSDCTDANCKPVRRVNGRAGETSDECESEEDRRAGGHAHSDCDSRDAAYDDDRDNDDDEPERTLGASGVAGKTFCYICYDGDDERETNPLVAPCHCKGDTKYVHLNCLQRWNNNLDDDTASANQKVCAVTNTDGLDVCTICKATYLTSVALDDGRVVSLLAQKLPPPYVTFAVVTQHETRNRQTALTNTRFQLSFANMPRNQQYLTIGRSTNNNMTLRYRTVSQLHAKIKCQDDNFLLYDALSSNGTMLFLSRPLELEWNKTVHVKIGRTILTLKSKKRWRWAGGANSEHASSSSNATATAAAAHALDDVSTATTPPHSLFASAGVLADVPLATTPTHRSNSISPPPLAPARANTTSHARALQRSAVLNRFESSGSARSVSDPSAALAVSPFEPRTFPAPPSFAAANRRGVSDCDVLPTASAAADGGRDAVEEEPLLLSANAAATNRLRARASSTESRDAANELDASVNTRFGDQQQRSLHEPVGDNDNDADALFYEMVETFERLDVRRQSGGIDECDVAAAAAIERSSSPIVVGGLAGVGDRDM